MDNMFEEGLKQRKATLGAEYVEKTSQPLTTSLARFKRR